MSKDRDFSEREAEENEIVNRHMAEMMQELHTKNFKPEAVLGFVVFGGRTERTTDYNLMTLIDSRSVTIPHEQAREALLSYVHDEICDMLDDGEEDDESDEPHEPPPSDAN